MPTALQRWTKQAQPQLQTLAYLLDLAANPDIMTVISAADQLCDEAAALRVQAVTEAKRQGATWEEIGQALGGLTRQAAWERFRIAVGDEELTPPHTATS